MNNDQAGIAGNVTATEKQHALDCLQLAAVFKNWMNAGKQPTFSGGDMRHIIQTFENSAALASQPAQPVQEPVAVKAPAIDPAPHYCKPHRFLLLASYCGGDTEGCTDERPCVACLSMCNIFGENGEYLSELGDPSAPRPAQEPVAWMHPTANWSHVGDAS